MVLCFVWAASLSQATFISYSLLNYCPAQKDNLWWYKNVCITLDFSGACGVYITTEFGPYFVLIWYKTGIVSNLAELRRCPQGRHRHCAKHVGLLATWEMFPGVMQPLHPGCQGQGTGGPKRMGNKVSGFHSRTNSWEWWSKYENMWIRRESERPGL